MLRSRVGSIRYPFARSEKGAIDIEDYEKGPPVTCFGCGTRVVAKQGRKNRWHFAHAVEPAIACNPETALHRLSKVLVQEGFAAALTDRRPYLLRWCCPFCSQPRSVDCTRWWMQIEVESTPTAGVRSDLLFVGERSIAIEIVVTHDVDETTVARYANADLPVFTVRPTWDTVSTLRNELTAAEAFVPRSERCPTCREAIRQEREHEPRVERLRQQLDNAPLLDDRIAEQRLEGWPPELDRFGRTLYPGVRRTMADVAIRLMMLGFTQQDDPWVFVLDLPDDVGTIFAGPGDARYSPLWKQPFPKFRFDMRVDGARHRYVEVVIGFLERRGLRVGDVPCGPEPRGRVVARQVIAALIDPPRLAIRERICRAETYLQSRPRPLRTGTR